MDRVSIFFFEVNEYSEQIGRGGGVSDEVVSVSQNENLSEHKVSVEVSVFTP